MGQVLVLFSGITSVFPGNYWSASCLGESIEDGGSFWGYVDAENGPTA
jgi:hypothetical protein